MPKQHITHISISNTLKSIYFTLAPKGSRLYSLTHTTIRKFLNKRYSSWIKHFDTWRNEDLKRIQQEISTIQRKPLISVIMPVYNPNLEYLDQAIQSVRDQVYPHWELCIVDDASTSIGVQDILQKHSQDDLKIKVIYRKTNGHISAASNTALEMATGEFVALLDHDDMLHPLALYEVAKTINEHPDAIVIYSDEDKLTPKGTRIDPYFKSDFDPDLFLSQNMVSHLGVYRRQSMLSIGGFREGLEGSQDYDLLLRILPEINHSQIRHIPKVLYHWRISEHSVADRIDIKPYALEAGRKAISDYLAKKNIDASVDTFENFGYKIKYSLPAPAPSVEIFINSQKPVGQWLEMCFRLIERAEYDRAQMTLNITADETDQERLEEALSSRYPHIQLRISTAHIGAPSDLNQQIQQSQAEFITLIDHLCVDFTQGWLRNLLSFADQPGIGCVSPKLIYKNGVIYSCGLILNRDALAHRLFNSASATQFNYYFGWSSLHKGYSALPDSCVVFKKAHFLSMGGINHKISGHPARLIELCLKMKSAGLRNVVVPEAIVTIDKTINLLSRQPDEVVDINQTDQQYLLQRWKQWFDHDPAFNPNLTLRKGKPIVSTEPGIDH